MSGKRYSATLHRRGGITMGIEVPHPIPEAIARPAEVDVPGKPGTPSGRYGERLFRRRSSDDGALHYIQDHDVPEPSESVATDTPALCSSCGRGSATFFLRSMKRTEFLTPSSPRLCVDCYDSQAI
ncbi:MAG TPA: hypothetical protein VMM18_04115 [Gemmatimonadaceae bacterium]|nr:hypothetical protein [Gemmatimonadaceae bacterium]